MTTGPSPQPQEGPGSSAGPAPTYITVFRVGAAVLLLAAVVLGILAVSINPNPAPDARLAQYPTNVSLPDLGAFGGSVEVYADLTVVERTSPSDFDCVLVDADGDELSSAKMSAGIGPTRTRDIYGQELVRLFSVSSYPDGARVKCPGLADASPVAVLAPTTFGENAGMVRAFAAGTALLCLLVAAAAFAWTRRR